MSFTKNNQSKISQLEKEATSKIKGGDDPNDTDELDASKVPCEEDCYAWVGNRVISKKNGL